MVTVGLEEEKEGEQGRFYNGRYSRQSDLVSKLRGCICKGVGTSGRYRQSPFLLFLSGVEQER